ncbi:MAG: oligosaccharide repeat unit polymerase [Bacilli bacterium]|nr:oligosaccharide repeat unit polymerase [Bacilli bacterium]
MDKKDIILLCIIYAIILLFTSIYLIRIIKTKRYTPSHNGILISVMVYYLIMPILVLCNIETLNGIEVRAGIYGSDTFQRFIINGKWKNYIYSIVMIVLMISFFIFFYQVSYKKNKERNYKFNFKGTYNIVKILTYITFFVGLFSLVLFFASFGGIAKALSYAETMRNMSNSLVEMIGSAALLKIIARLITVTPFLSLYLINEKREKNFVYKMIFIISLIASILFYLYNAGRTPIIMFMLCFVYVILSTKVKKTWTIIILLGIVSLPILDILDSLFVYFNTGLLDIKQNEYVNYIYQFSVPYKNTLILGELNETFGLRWGQDFITAFLDLLPGVNFDPPYVNLSFFVRGSEWKNLGGIPADYITFSHMEFSYIGVIGFSGIIGYLTQIIDYKLSLFENKKMKSLLGGILTVFFFSTITSSDVASIIRGQFILLIVIFIIMKSSKKEKS